MVRETHSTDTITQNTQTVIPNRLGYELKYYEQQVRRHTKRTFHCSRPRPKMALRIQYGFHHITREIGRTKEEMQFYIYIYWVRQKKCVHTLTKENSTLYNRLL